VIAVTKVNVMYKIDCGNITGDISDFSVERCLRFCYCLQKCVLSFFTSILDS